MDLHFGMLKLIQYDDIKRCELNKAVARNRGYTQSNGVFVRIGNFGGDNAGGCPVLSGYAG